MLSRLILEMTPTNGAHMLTGGSIFRYWIEGVRGPLIPHLRPSHLNSPLCFFLLPCLPEAPDAAAVRCVA